MKIPLLTLQTSSPRCRRSRPSPAGPAAAAAGTRPRPAGHRRRVESLPVVTYLRFDVLADLFTH